MKSLTNIKSILAKLHEAHTESAQFNGQVVRSNIDIRIHDFFEMCIAYDYETLISLELNLAYADAYPDLYSSEQIRDIKAHQMKLSEKIKAWQHKRFPDKD